ncbi:MAG: hemolysin family protein [Planctomycetota bacterium]
MSRPTPPLLAAPPPAAPPQPTPSLRLLAIAPLLGPPWAVMPAAAAEGEAFATAGHVAGAVAAVGIAAFGALAMASLAGYSPTRAQQMLDEAGGDDRQRNAIGKLDAEFQVVAWLWLAAGWCGGLWCTGRAFPDHPVIAVAGFVAALALFAGSLPLGIARVQPERTLLALLPALRASWYLLRWPLVLPILWPARLGVRMAAPAEPAAGDATEVQKQVMAAVADSVTDDSLPAVERTWIGNIVGLQDLQVATLMTPRPDIVAFPETMALREAVQKALEHGFSRYPVYRERIDEVVGIFYVKDALRLAHDDTGKLAATPLQTMLRQPLFVPETTGAAQLLRRFQAGNQHMAIVIDEYGTTVGLVTVEDVLEQIVGDIGDEYDAPVAGTPSNELQVIESGRVLEFPARTTVAEINALLGSELPEQGDWETIAGLVLAHANHIPAVDETMVVDGVEFRVLQADDRRIRRLRATLLAPETAGGQG